MKIRISNDACIARLSGKKTKKTRIYRNENCARIFFYQSTVQCRPSGYPYPVVNQMRVSEMRLGYI
jgi:hypothetical protein